MALKKLLTAVIFFPLFLLGEEKVFITVQPFRDWKPKITFESNSLSGKLKVEYKLFSTPKVKYKLFHSLSAGFQIKGFSLPRLSVKLDSKVKYIVEHLGRSPFPLKSPVGEKSPLLCSYKGDKRFCPLKVKGKKVVISIGGSFKDFTLFLIGEVVKDNCPLLVLESFPSYPWATVVKKGETLEIQVGDTAVSVPQMGKKIKIALVKGGKSLNLFLPDRSFYTLPGPPVVYLYRALLNKGCLKRWHFYFYPTAKGKEEIFLTLSGD